MKGCLSIIVIVMIAVAVITYPFMWLWNWLMPQVFGLGEVTFWQAFGLLAFIGIIASLFKNKKE